MKAQFLTKKSVELVYTLLAIVKRKLTTVNGVKSSLSTSARMQFYLLIDVTLLHLRWAGKLNLTLKLIVKFFD